MSRPPSPGLLHRLVHRLRHGGVSGIALALANRLVPPSPPALARHAAERCRDRRLLEVGGPSPTFGSRGLVPLYDSLAACDNVNFAHDTPWESALAEGAPFVFSAHRPAGRQWLREASDLAGIADHAYDGVLSCHCLEHLANPLRALREWHRVTRPGGLLMILVPDPRRTFDHRRPVTALDHLRQDFAQGTDENDLTHLPEILALHDLSRDPGAGNADAFAARSRANARHRCLHHHVFDASLLAAVLAETGWRIDHAERFRPAHLAALATRL